FYFRFALGVGQGHDSVKSDRPLPTERVFVSEPLEGSGGAFAGVTEMAIGFTPFSGVVLGVGAYTVTIPKLVLTPKDASTGDYHYRVTQLAVIGPLIDWYFNPASGFRRQVEPRWGNLRCRSGGARAARCAGAGAHRGRLRVHARPGLRVV